jgi:hypothetical protein
LRKRSYVPSSFLDDGPTSNLIRQILGAVSEFDKAMTVAKLKGARDRVRRAQGKCEGRKAYAERKGGHELVALARQLRGNLDGPPQPLRFIWPSVVASPQAVAPIRLRQSLRCLGKGSPLREGGPGSSRGAPTPPVRETDPHFDSGRSLQLQELLRCANPRKVGRRSAA